MATFLVLGLLLVACGEAAGDTGTTPTPELAGDPEATVTPEAGGVPETPEALLARFAEEVERGGEVFHATSSTVMEPGKAGREQGAEAMDLFSEEVWIAGDVARKLFKKAPGNEADLAEEAVSILIEDRIYDGLGTGFEVDISAVSPSCQDTDTPPSAAFVLQLFCSYVAAAPEQVGEITTEIEAQTEFEGQPAVALVFHVQLQPEGELAQSDSEPQTLISSLFLDPGDFLPMGWEATGQDAEGGVLAVIRTSFEREFIERDDLEAGFFEPFSLLAEQPAVPVYWLGNQFDPKGDLPEMVTRGINLPQGSGPAYQINLEYSAPYGTERWPNDIFLQHWDPEDWEQVGSETGSDLWLNPCAESQTVDVEDGEATVYLTFEPTREGELPDDPTECPDREFDRFVGLIHFDDVVVAVNTPFGGQLHPRTMGDSYDPYDSLEGVRAIIEGLQPWRGPATTPSPTSEPPASPAPTKPDPTASPAATGDVPPLTEIYAGLAGTLQQAGMVLHTIMSVGSEVSGFGSSELTVEQWVDGNGSVARLEMTGVFRSEETGEEWRAHDETIVAGGTRYRHDLPDDDFDDGDEYSVVEAEGCYGQPEAIAEVIGCPGPTETSTTMVEWGEYDAQRVLILVIEGVTRGSDESTDFVRRTYLDPETYLPIAMEETGTFNTAQSYPESASATYEHEFIERASLPEDFFDPESLGYEPPDLTGWLDDNVETPVYWLGERFEPGGNLPPLVLSGVQGAGDLPDTLPSYEAILTYAPEESPHGASAATIQVWPVADWDAEHGGGPAIEAGMAGRPCLDVEQIPLEGGEATLYSWREGEITATPPSPSTPDTGAPDSDSDQSCEDGGPERFTAIVRFPDTVLLIDAPSSSSPRDGIALSSFNTREGILALIQGLERR